MSAANPGKRIGAGTRLALSSQLVLNLALALAAAFGAIWLVGRPGLRLRYDATEKGTNTLSTSTRGVLTSLEQELTLDVFWRGEDKPLDTVAPAGMDRVWRLLQLMQAEAGERLRILSHDAATREAIETRLRELRLTGYENCVVVSCGDQRSVVPFRGKLVDFDPGDPRRESYRPAAIRSFPAEESIVQALLEVTRGEERKVYFTVGQGERRLADEKEAGLARLQTVLGEEALQAVEWEWERTQAVPEDCAVLAIVAPETAFPPGQRGKIESWIAEGGRVLIAGHPDPTRLDDSDVPELLQAFGMDIGPGVVMNPAFDSLGNPSFDPQYVVLVPVVPQGMTSHPITDLLRQAGRRLLLVRSHPLLVRRQPEAPRVGSAFPLLQTSAQVWLDSAPYDYLPDGTSEEGGPFSVAAVLRFLPEARETTPDLAERRETRLVALGGAGLLENDRADLNSDFARNVFRWLASREWRVSITTRDPDERLLPVHQRGVMASIARTSLLWIPLACLLLGLATAFARSRGGSRRTAA